VEESSLTHSEILTVLVTALVGAVIFGYWLRKVVLVQMAKKAKHKYRSKEGGPRRVGPGFSRKQRRH
jgi:hypothetical protein